MTRYEVVGIHCKTCVDKITEAISKVGKYSLAPINEDIVHINSDLLNSNASWFKIYYPLLLIIGFITVVATFTSFNGGFLIDRYGF
ncbi:MAG: hypothetical protein AB8B68_02340 [Rickettsiaceae bacterium]